MWVVYIIQSEHTKDIYIGCTNNFKRRLFQHNNDKNLATKNKGPWVLVYCEVYRSKEDAYLREKRLKYFGKALGQLKVRISKSLL